MSKQVLQKPILLFDIMSTLVSEPFFEAVPAFLGLDLKELRESKNHEAFLAFEKGAIDEDTYSRTFFKDERPFDKEGFKRMLYDSYTWLPGVESLLLELKSKGYSMYALSNYSEWYRIIERKLSVSNFVEWSFVSCQTGIRKPDEEAYLLPLRRLGVEASDCIFIDDREKNTSGAEAVGIRGILRAPENIDRLRQDLASAGVEVRTHS